VIFYFIWFDAIAAYKQRLTTALTGMLKYNNKIYTALSDVSHSALRKTEKK